MEMVTDHMDFDAQQISHWAFFGHGFPKDVRSIDIHDDLPQLREYLKKLFSLLYRYDVVMRECGLDPKWEEEVTGWIGWISMAKTQCLWIDNGHVKQFV